jgi:Domain of unknown function (DUF1707)
MATDPNIRVSDADRDAVAAQLREHYAQGRLTLDELNERLDRTFSARTNLELASVTADLPYAPPRGVLPSDRLRGGYGQSGQGWAGSGQNRGGQGRGSSGWTGMGSGGRGGGYGYGRRCGRGSILGLLPLLLVVWACLILVSAFGFGIGSGPSLIVIILGALAVLRRLLGLGRRRTMPTRRRSYRRHW